MQIKQTAEGRVIEIDGQQHTLPALAVQSSVHVWSKGDEHCVYTQAQGQPEEVPASSGWSKIASVELEADEQEALRQHLARLQIQCNELRDIHIDSGMIFNGTRFQTRSTDRENISGAALLATQVVMSGGGNEGDYRWQDPDADFEFIASDNSAIKMDAPTTMRFGQEAAAHKQRLIMFCRDLKDQIALASSQEEADQILRDAAWPS